MHHYLIQKDLLTITIEKQMIISQQLQLKQFFEKSQDAVIVATNDEEPKIQLFNKSVFSVLGLDLNSNPEVVVEQPEFNNIMEERETTDPLHLPIL